MVYVNTCNTLNFIYAYTDGPIRRDLGLIAEMDEQG